jgi:hypothetical protein
MQEKTDANLKEMKADQHLEEEIKASEEQAKRK